MDPQNQQPQDTTPPAPASGDNPPVAPGQESGSPAPVQADPSQPAAAPGQTSSDPLSQVPPQTLAKNSRRMLPIFVVGLVIILVVSVVVAVLMS